MALSTVIKNFTDGSITIKDGTGTPLEITVALDEGNFTMSGLAAQLSEVAAYESRGSFSGLRHTTRTYPSGSFSAKVAEFSEDSTGTLADAILKQGTVWAAAVSTSGASADVYTVDLVFAMEGTDHGDSADATVTLEDCYCTIDFAEGDPNTFTITFTCYGSISGDITITAP
jgi:hypothetical protein